VDDDYRYSRDEAAKNAILGELLETHKGVPFVDRILAPNRYPIRQNPDGSTSTHLLSTIGGGPGEPLHVAPSLQLIDGKWVEGDPWDAVKRKNSILFPSTPEGRKSAEDLAGGSWKTLPSVNRAAGDRGLLQNPMPPKPERD